MTDNTDNSNRATIGVTREQKIMFDEFAADWGKFSESTGELLMRMIKELKNKK